MILQGSCSETVYKIRKKDLKKLTQKQKEELKQILSNHYYSDQPLGKEYDGDIIDEWKPNDRTWEWIFIYQSDIDGLQRFLEKNNIEYKGRFWLCDQYPIILRNIIKRFLEKKLNKGETEIDKIVNNIIDLSKPNGIGLNDLSVKNLKKKINSIKSCLLSQDNKDDLIKSIIKFRKRYIEGGIKNE